MPLVYTSSITYGPSHFDANLLCLVSCDDRPTQCKDEISNLKRPWADLLVECLGKLCLVAFQMLLSFEPSIVKCFQLLKLQLCIFIISQAFLYSHP